MDGYTIGRARPDDLPLLAAIEAAASRLFDEHPLTAGLGLGSVAVDDHDATPHEHLWVARDDTGRPVGFALGEPLEDGLHLEEIDVDPAHARRGIGAALVRTVIDAAHAMRCSAVTLTTFTDIPWNAPFYARLGFVVVPPTSWTPGLRAVVADEESRGLPAHLRVVMRYAIAAA